MEFELGQTYSGYKFLDVAQRSKSGVEYRVQNTLTQRMELLKVLSLSAQDDREETERFMREMRVRAKLVHPNIVTFFTAMPLEGRLVMTTELVDGLPLSERLQLGPIPWREAVAFARQVLAAVDCAHQQQIVHRDISPDNIIAVPGGGMKLTNFRLAKSAQSLHLTQSGAIVGSLKYISPEQVKGTEAVDSRSDIYSIGIVFYEMLAGRTPFNSTSQFELMLAHVNQQPEPASKFNSTIPSQLDAVVLKALAKFPSDRYQSAGEFDEALARAIIEIAPAEISPAAEITPAPEPAAVLQPLEAVMAASVEPSPAIEPEVIASEVIAPEVVPPVVVAPELVAPAVAEVFSESVVAATELPATLQFRPIALPAAASVALEPVAAATELPEVLKLEFAGVPGVAEVAPESAVLSVSELPQAIEPETAVVLAVAEAAPQPVAAAAELPLAIEPEFPSAPAAGETAPRPVLLLLAGPPLPVQSEVQPEPPAAAAPAILVPVLLPETAVYASLWNAAEVVSRAAQVPAAPCLDLLPVLAELRPAPGEAAHATALALIAAPVVTAPAAGTISAVLPGPSALSIATANQPALDAAVPTLPGNPAGGFLAAAKARSESVQWAVFGGTAAFLGVVWAAIWFITGK